MLLLVATSTICGPWQDFIPWKFCSNSWITYRDPTMTMVVDNRYQLFRCSHVLCLVCTGDSQDLRTCQLHPWDKIGHIRKQCWSEPQVARRLIPRIPGDHLVNRRDYGKSKKSIKIQKPGVWFFKLPETWSTRSTHRWNPPDFHHFHCENCLNSGWCHPTKSGGLEP